jgi:hypothetical protein
MLQAFYGNYAFPAGASMVKAHTRLNVNKGGQPYSHTDTLELECFLPVNSQSDCTQKLSALEKALAIPFQDLVVKDDSGNPTVLVLRNKGSIGGVLVTMGPDYPEFRGPAYVTEMRIAFTAEAEYPFAGTQNMLLEFEEKLSFSGGGPIKVYKNAINTLPQLQMPFKFTFYQMIQAGRALGYRKYPTPSPIYPALVMRMPDIDMDSPDRHVKNYTNYPVTWRYVMQSPKPIIAVPTLWKG